MEETSTIKVCIKIRLIYMINYIIDMPALYLWRANNVLKGESMSPINRLVNL